jgi:hypothetical protein
MKHFLALTLLALSLFVISAPAKQVKQAGPDLAKSTLLVYHGKQVCKWTVERDFFFEMDRWGCAFETRFTCTATVVGAQGGNYVGLTAGHCFNWKAADAGEYFISDTLTDKPVVHKIHLIKFENDDRYDFALFEFNSLEHYDAIPLAERVDLKVGDQVSNVNYAFGLAKQVTHGAVISTIIRSPALSGLKDTKGRFLVSIGVGPGASGSAVLNAKGEIIGIVEAIFPGTQMPTIVMPTGKALKDFYQDDSAGLKPEIPGPLPKLPEKPEPETLLRHALRAFREFFKIY